MNKHSANCDEYDEAQESSTRPPVNESLADDDYSGTGAPPKEEQHSRQNLPWERIRTVIDGAVLAVAIGSLWLLGHQTHDIENQAMLEQRAWVGPLGEKIKTFTRADPKGISKFVIEVPFTNFGKTPALNVHAWIGTTPNAVPSANPTDDPSVSAETVFPQDVSNTSAWLPASTAREIQRGRHVATYGTLFYDDIFGNKHWTQFCFYVGPDLKSFGPCVGHNSTDGADKAKDNTGAGASGISS